MPHSTLTVGNVEITVLHDAEVALPFRRTFPDVPLEAWKPYIERYPDAYSSGDSLRVHFECYLVRSQGRTLLVDTGLGNATSNPNVVASIGGGSDGVLLSELEAAGFQAEDIDTVFLTHLHPDHVGWNLTNDEPTFPNARYLVPKSDWDYWTQPDVLANAAHVQDQVLPLDKLNILDLMEDDYKITDDLTTVATPGHTPGHVSIVIVSNGERGFILGDVAHSPAQAHRTDWNPGFDIDGETSQKTRHAMLDQLETEGIFVASGHFPAPGFGKFVRDAGRRIWEGV